jgi:hypothetical protein
VATFFRTPSLTPSPNPTSSTTEGRPCAMGAPLPIANRLLTLGRSVAAIAGDLELGIRQPGLDLVEIVDQCEALRELLVIVADTAVEGIDANAVLASAKHPRHDGCLIARGLRAAGLVVLVAATLFSAACGSPASPDPVSAPVSPTSVTTSTQACEANQTAQVTFEDAGPIDLTLMIDGHAADAMHPGDQVTLTESAHVVHTIWFTNPRTGDCVCRSGIAAQAVFAACETRVIACGK